MTNPTSDPLPPGAALADVRRRLADLTAAVEVLAEACGPAPRPRRAKAGSWEEVEARAAAFERHRALGCSDRDSALRAAGELECHEKSVRVARKLVQEVPERLVALVRGKVITCTTLHDLLQESRLGRGAWQPGLVHDEICAIRQALRAGWLLPPRAPEGAEITHSTIRAYRDQKPGRAAPPAPAPRKAAAPQPLTSLRPML